MTSRGVTVAAVAAGLCAAGCAPVGDGAGAGTAVDEITNAPLISSALLGHLRFETSTCSAELVTNEWAVAAGQCVTPAQAARPASIVLAMNPTGTAARRHAVQVVRHPTQNIVAIRVDEPFVMPSGLTGFAVPIYAGTTATLAGKTLTCFGWGSIADPSALRRGSLGPPALGRGTMTASAPPPGSDVFRIYLGSNREIQFTGDEGGGCFLPDGFGALQLVSITSSWTAPYAGATPDYSTNVGVAAFRSWLAGLTAPSPRGRFFGARQFDAFAGADWSWYAPWSTDLITMRSNRDGSFTQVHTTTSSLAPLGSAPLFGAGDFNGDGYGDWLYYDASRRENVVLLNNAFGGYEATERTSITPLGNGSGVEHYRVADFNNDRFADVSFYHRPSDALIVLMGLGNGQFAAPRVVHLPAEAPLSPGALRFRTGDFDGDGDADWSWLSEDHQKLVIAFADALTAGGGGSVRFVARDMAMTTSLHRQWVVGDFNGDRTDDWGFYDSDSSQFVTLTSYNSGYLADTMSTGKFGDWASGRHIAVGDFDGDGDADWSWYAPWSNDFIVMLSLRDGTYFDVHNDTSGWGDWSDARYFAVADFDNDARRTPDWMWYAPWSRDVIVMLSDGQGHYRAFETDTSGWGVF